MASVKHLNPQAAWKAIQGDPQALLMDVRMEIESLYVGRPPGSVHIAWYEYPDLTPDPAAFVAAVEREAGRKDRPLYLICRSGTRSVQAAQALLARGFTDVTNIAEGFEGDADAHFHRSTINGWRHAGLPWVQM